MKAATAVQRKFGDKGYWPRLDDGTPVVTQSMVSTFVDCPREVYYGTVLGLRPRLESIPLTRGTWIHALMEERGMGRDWRVKHQELLEKGLAEQFEEEITDLANQCYNIMISYEWLYRNDDLKPITAELTVERPMFGGKALYRGRIDLIVQDKNGNVWLVDHKTHQAFPDWNYRELAFQHYSYLWACRKSPAYLALGIPQPKGFIYDYCKTNSIKTPTLTQKGKLSRTLKASGTTYPVLRQWLKDNHLMTTIRGKDLLAIEDPEESAYVEELLVATRTRDYSSLFRRDYLVFTKEQERRQIKAFLTSARRLLQYSWRDPDCVERGVHHVYPCRYQDLSVSDLMHGDSTIERKTRYKISTNPLDYYDNKDKKGKK